MAKFGKRSSGKLMTCHPDLQRLFNEVVKHYDCAVLCGHRNEENQDEAFNTGRSTVEYPNSTHNKLPSLGVDVVPWFSAKPHIRWNDMEKFYEFKGFVEGTAAQLGIKIRSGLDWDRDGDLHDQRLIDGPHFELLD